MHAARPEVYVLHLPKVRSVCRGLQTEEYLGGAAKGFIIVAQVLVPSGQGTVPK